MVSKRFFILSRLTGIVLLVVFGLKISDNVVRGIALLKRDAVAKELTKNADEKTEPEGEKAKKAKKFSPETYAIAATLVRAAHSPADASLKYHYIEQALADAYCNIHKPPPDRHL